MTAAAQVGKEIITQYMVFTLVEKMPRTNVWVVSNKRDNGYLGLIRWYGPWRQYCYMPGLDVVLNRGCLERIIKFIAEEA